MSVVRRFLVAPSLVRLIRKERGGSRISEGYFAPQAGRTSFVRIDGQNCHLVLVSNGSAEEWTEVPRAHGDALLDVCAGKALYERTTVSLGGAREATIDRYTTPAGLDLISVAFDDAAGAQAFRPPVWFGSEVSDNDAYERHAVALQGVPSAGEITLTNAALDAVLDLIEPRFGFGRNVSAPPASPRRDEAPAAAKPIAAATPPVKEAAPVTPPEPAVPTKPAEAPPPAKELEARKPEEQKPEAKAPESKAAEFEEADAKREPSANPEGKAASDSAPAKDAPPSAPEGEKGDARIDDVIESLSQALGAAMQKPQAPAREDELAASFERWTVRPRRS